jgi:hypothetical protein
MRPLALLLVPAALFAGQFRFARLSDFEGKVEVQLQAADPWMPGERNLPLVEGTWLRTGPASRLEIELDEGSAWHVGPDSQVEISDYSRLSTGQRITLLSLDRGLAYFTGEPHGKDSLSLTIPGAQVVFTRGARIRLQAQDNWSEVVLIEGSAMLSSPQVEVVVAEGQTLRLDPADSSILSFTRQVKALDLDAWSEARDKALYLPAATSHVPQRYGLADLDHAGEWVDAGDLGEVWKPQAPHGWVPFRNGRWRWYASIGYTWISDDPWGWLPYHYGRWAYISNLGWVWASGGNEVFKPGEVYWLHGAKLAGWGPLEPGEAWTPSSTPLQFLDANTVYAAWVQDARLIDPAGFTGRPKDPLAVARFVLALPSPAFAASRLDAVRPVQRSGGARVTPAKTGVTYDPPAPAPDTSPSAAGGPGPADPANPSADPPPAVSPPPPLDVAYSGIIMMNPAENPDYVRRQPPHQTAPAAPPPQTAKTPASSSPAVPPTAVPGSPAPAPAAPHAPPAPPDQPQRAPFPQPMPVQVPARATPIPVSPGAPAVSSPAGPKNQ